MTGAAGLPAILADIKLAHSVFALPFAVIGLLVGTRGAWPEPLLWLQILLAMVLARSTAMAANRLADARFDATNPRTEGRALPSGRVARGQMRLFAWTCAAGFVGVAYWIAPLCGALAPAVLLVLCGYSYAKRFTPLAHLWLGAALALSPAAAYLAARGEVGRDVIPVFWLCAAVMCWVAGFDIIYACQDIEHDRREGLASLPARLGVTGALWISRLLHLGMLLALVQLVSAAGLGAPSWLGIAVVALLLVVEHGLVSGGDLSRVNAAFFTVNGSVGLLFGLFVGADLLWP